MWYTIGYKILIADSRYRVFTAIQVWTDSRRITVSHAFYFQANSHIPRRLKPVTEISGVHVWNEARNWTPLMDQFWLTWSKLQINDVVFRNYMCNYSNFKLIFELWNTECTSGRSLYFDHLTTDAPKGRRLLNCLKIIERLRVHSLFYIMVKTDRRIY